MNTITTPNFTGKVAKTIAKIINRTCIDDDDVEVIEAILQDMFIEECSMLAGYYEEEYYNAISSARSKAYDDGHSDGYDDGYESGYADCHAKNNYAV